MRLIAPPRMLEIDLESHEHNVQHNSMRKKSSNSRCTARCRWSALDVATSAAVLLTFLNIVLLENTPLNFVAGAQLNIFLNKRFHFKDPACSTAHSRG